MKETETREMKSRERVGKWVGRWVGRKPASDTVVLVSKNPPLSKRKLAEHIGINTTAIDKNIAALKNKGYLQRIGPDRGGHWEVLK